jgi:hypothetical protein
MDPKQFFFTKPIFLGDEFEFGALMLASAHDSLLISYIIIFMMHSHLMVTSSIDLSSSFLSFLFFLFSRTVWCGDKLWGCKMID